MRKVFCICICICSFILHGEWSEPLFIDSDVGDYYSYSTDIATNGKAAFVWIKDGAAYSRFWNGNSLSESIKIVEDENIESISVGYRSSGEAIVVYRSDSNVFASRYSPSSQEWNVPEQINFTGPGTDVAVSLPPLISLSDNGKAIIGFVGTDDSLYGIDSSGSDWNFAVSLSDGIEVTEVFSLSSNDEGEGVVVWLSDSDELYSNRYVSGSFEESEDLGEINPAFLLPSVAMNNNGEILIGAVTGEGVIYFAIFQNSSWDTLTPLEVGGGIPGVSINSSFQTLSAFYSEEPIVSASVGEGDTFDEAVGVSGDLETGFFSFQYTSIRQNGQGFVLINNFDNMYSVEYDGSSFGPPLSLTDELEGIGDLSVFTNATTGYASTVFPDGNASLYALIFDPLNRPDQVENVRASQEKNLLSIVWSPISSVETVHVYDPSGERRIGSTTGSSGGITVNIGTLYKPTGYILIRTENESGEESAPMRVFF